MTSAIVPNQDENQDENDGETKEESSRPALFDASALGRNKKSEEGSTRSNKKSTELVPHDDSDAEILPKKRNVLRRRRGAPAHSLKLTLGQEDHLVTYELAEQMRLLLARSDIGTADSTLAIASTVAGEGTTFIARSLAAVLAHDSQLAVCLLEFDWDAVGEGETVEAIAVRGIVDEGKNALDEDTGKEFTFVSSGHVAPLQRSLFVSSEHLADDIASLREYFDVVILDLPAITSHSGVLTLGEFADAFLLVVRQGAAPAAQIRAAMEDLRDTKLAGIVMNNVKITSPGWLRRVAGY